MPAVSERIALVTPSAVSILRLRDDLVRELIGRRHRVLCVTPEGTPKEMRLLRELGTQHRPIDYGASGVPVLSDWQAVTAMKEIFADWQPNIVMGFGLRPMASAAVAGKRAGVRRIVSFVNEGLPRDGLLSLDARRLAYGLQSSDAIVFHNREAPKALQEKGVLPEGADYTVVPGAGVDLERYTPTPMPRVADGLVFLMLGHLDPSRGVLEYAKAANLIQAKSPLTRFLLAGPKGSDPRAWDTIDRTAQGCVEYLGDLDDVRPALARCHVLVQPSHQEGMPRAVLEALATGRPVITTDTPGCRDSVDEKVSGCLVEPGQTADLTRAMESFLKHPDSLPAMSRAARLKAERRFDVRHVNDAIIQLLGV
jgi:glycosyltransferase involved in cell wall biosynthesis